MKKLEILHYWMAKHGELTPKQQGEFLNRNELNLLMSSNPDYVKECISKYKMLEDIAACVEDRRPPMLPKSTNTHTSKPEESISLSKDTQTRSGRSRTRGEVWEPPVPYGTPDTRYK